MEVIGNPKYKRVYISGPITGIPDKNKYAFEKYENRFKELNLDPVNPLKLFTEQEALLMDLKLENNEITEKEYWAYFMKRDIAEMIECDIVAVLPNWENSKGANLEVYLARSLFMPIIDATNLQLLGIGPINLNK